MDGSVAIEPTAGVTEGATVTGTEGAEATSPQFDTSQFDARFDEVRSSLDEFRTLLTQSDEDEDGEDDYVVPDLPQPTDDPAAQAKAVQDYIAQLVEQGVKQQITPLQSDLAKLQSVAAAERLEALYPELANSDEAVEKVMAKAEELATSLGVQDPNNTQLLELAYLAERGRQAAQSEVPAGAAPGTTLESGSGAVPSGAGEVDPGDAIVNAGNFPKSLYA